MLPTSIDVSILNVTKQVDDLQGPTHTLLASSWFCQRVSVTINSIPIILFIIFFLRAISLMNEIYSFFFSFFSFFSFLSFFSFFSFLAFFSFFASLASTSTSGSTASAFRFLVSTSSIKGEDASFATSAFVSPL